MRINQALKTIGLSEIEVDVYLAILKVSGAQAASVIANRINMNRTTAYKALVELAKKGLVTKTIQHGIICFFAEAPEEKLKDLLEEKKENLRDLNKAILDALPTLTKPEDANTFLPKVRYYEGIEGIKKIYELTLKEGVNFYQYGDICKNYKIFGDFTIEYINKRKKLGIKVQSIMPYHKGSEKLYKRNHETLLEALFIPLDLFPIDGEILIFDNKVAIISLKEGQLLGVIIESDIIANMFRSVFMLTWKGYNKRLYKP